MPGNRLATTLGQCWTAAARRSHDGETTINQFTPKETIEALSKWLTINDAATTQGIRRTAE